jgi:hypothetical protein
MAKAEPGAIDNMAAKNAAISQTAKSLIRLDKVKLRLQSLGSTGGAQIPSRELRALKARLDRLGRSGDQLGRGLWSPSALRRMFGGGV